MAGDTTIQPSASSDRSAQDAGSRGDSHPLGSRRFIAWFKTWSKPLRHWIRRNASVPSAEADDLAQEVFLRLLRYSNDVMVENPQGYLFTVARNVINTRRERCIVRLAHDASLEELQICPGLQPENDLSMTQAYQEIWAAVDRLPARQREILLLYVEDGLTYKQIAERKNLTYRIVLRDLTRAYAALREHLVRQDL